MRKLVRYISAPCVISASAVRAQSGPAQFGRITDIGRHANLGAEIVASCAGKSKPIVFHVDEKSDYRVGFGVPNGIDYSLEIRAQGYETMSVPICHADQLEPFYTNGECGSGQCLAIYDLRNASPHSCILPQTTTVRELNKGGAVIGEKSFHGQQELLLAPGAFGEYSTQSLNVSMYPKARPDSAVFELRFDSADRGWVRLPGNNEFTGGPSPSFIDNSQQPDLSRVPVGKSGTFAFSAYFWPPMDKHSRAGNGADLLDNIDGHGNIHVSVRNTGDTAAAGWTRCSVAVETIAEDHSLPPGRRTYPCAFNGDVDHGTIAAHAAVAFEVAMPVPQVCSAARFRVRVSLDHAPVTFDPIVLETGGYQFNSCSDPKSSKETHLRDPRTFD